MSDGRKLKNCSTKNFAGHARETVLSFSRLNGRTMPISSNMGTCYKQGADLMVEKAGGRRRDRDALVYPIIFNYRLFIELSLKYLISNTELNQ